MIERIRTSHSFQHFWNWAGSFSIRVKVLGIVLAVVVMLGLLVTINIRSVLQRTLGNELHVQGHALAASYAQQLAPFLLQDEIGTLSEYLEVLREHYSSAGHNTRIAFLAVIDQDQTLITIDPVRIDWQELPQDLIQVREPIRGTDASFVIGLSTVEITQVVTEVSLQLLAIILIMIVIGFIGAGFLTWILTRPIYALVAATRRVGQGDFSPRVPRWADDEIGVLSDAFNHMTASLADAEKARADREQLRAQFVSRVILAQEDERKRIARELHDSTGQSLTSLLVGLQNLRLHSAEPGFQGNIDELRSVVGRTLEEVRALAWQLRPAVLDDLGLLVAIQRYISDFRQRYQMTVDFTADPIEKRLPGELETTVYRIIQEGLTNIARHANASNASIMLDLRPNKLRIIIEDDGIGFDPDVIGRKHSLGLQGIRERATLLDGTMTIEASPGNGTSLFVELPLSQ